MLKTKILQLSVENIAPHSNKALPLRITLYDGERYVGIGTLHFTNGKSKTLRIDFDWLVRVHEKDNKSDGFEENDVHPIAEALRKNYHMEFEHPCFVLGANEQWKTIRSIDHTIIMVSDQEEHAKIAEGVKALL